MNTVIQFIGLFIVTSMSPAGLHIILPYVAVQPPHPSFIAYRQGDLVAQSGFPRRGTFTYAGQTFDWVDVHREVFEFRGATDPFSGDASDLPHLTCCCSAMRDGLKRAYADGMLPETQRRSAHFMVRNGTASVVNDPNNARVTEVTMSSATGIVVVAGGGRSLTFKPGARLLVGHEPLPGTAVTRSHFHAYYETGRNQAAMMCTSTPLSDPATCGPRPSGCDVPAPQHAAAPAHRFQPRVETIDIDCSNSHWP